jgi:hypothetical protein
LILFAYSYEFSGEDSGFFQGLLSFRGVSLRSTVGLDYEVLGLVFDILEMKDVTVEFACIASYDLIALSDLKRYQRRARRGAGGGLDLGLRIRLKEDGLDGFHFTIELAETVLYGR